MEIEFVGENNQLWSLERLVRLGYAASQVILIRIFPEGAGKLCKCSKQRNNKTKIVI